jgi:4'-phosphopantetheinyl transferase EntD
VAFDLSLEHGRCIGLYLPKGDEPVAALADSVLLPDERTFAEGLGSVRRRSWVGGRAALRVALSRAGLHAPAVLADARGAPRLPVSVAASISHKEDVAVALVASASAGVHLGVDIETDTDRVLDISSKVLADDELRELARLAPHDRGREVLLRFSAKESIYKAIDPFVARWVGFKEVSVSPHPAGDAAVVARLAEGPFDIEVRWRRFDGIVLTTARASLSGASTAARGGACSD